MKEKMERKTSLGNHFLIDLYECDYSLLNDVNIVKNILHNIIEKVGARLINENYKEFSPIGISGFAIISESHISVHTWPEYGFAAIDVFSCNKDLTAGISEYVQKQFCAKSYEVINHERGFIDRCVIEVKEGTTR